MKHACAFTFLVLLLLCLPSEQAMGQQELAKERAEALANSPARRRLDQIQQYKPVIRRSRALAIQEMEQDIAAAYIKLDAGGKMVKKQERLAKKNDPNAWPPERIEEAKLKMLALRNYVKESEVYLAKAKAEQAQVLELLARERSEHSITEEEEFEGDEEEGNSSLSIPGSTKPGKGSRPNTKPDKPPVEEEDIDED